MHLLDTQAKAKAAEAKSEEGLQGGKKTQSASE